MGNHQPQDVVQRLVRLPAHQLRDLVDTGHAPAHVLKAFGVGPVVRNQPQFRPALRQLLNALRQLQNRDFLRAADIVDVADLARFRGGDWVDWVR